jgi:hypothetical protein
MRPDPSQKRKARKEKAVSVSTGFVINMGVASVILSFMMLNLVGPTDQLMDSTERSHLDAVGQSVVSDLETADRLAREGMNGTVEISSPEAGTEYTVSWSKTRWLRVKYRPVASPSVTGTQGSQR